MVAVGVVVVALLPRPNNLLKNELTGLAFLTVVLVVALTDEAGGGVVGVTTSSPGSGPIPTEGVVFWTVS